MSTDPAPADPHTLLAALARDQVRLELGTYDVCCLAALHLRVEREGWTSVADDALADLFEQVSEFVDAGADNPRKRATHAIQRLLEQRLLLRVDAAGVASAGEYALASLATHIARAFLDADALTRESLTLLTGTLLSQLAEVKGAAARARTPQEWADRVAGPLRVTVLDLVAGIDRRQRGLDAEQAEVRARIADLLQEDWFGAVDRAGALLETTTERLAELNAVLMRDAHQLVALLQEIQDLAAAHPEGRTAVEAAQRVIEQVDRIALWGEARQRAWSEHYRYVHAYVRDVVRLDPDRSLTHGLRDQLAGWVERPFYLYVASDPPIAVLRDETHRVERPPVRRLLGSRPAGPTEVAPDDGPDLEALVEAALARGAASLAEVTEQVLAVVPEGRRFAAAGRVATLVAAAARVAPARERAWVGVGGGLEIEQWTLRGRRAP